MSIILLFFQDAGGGGSLIWTLLPFVFIFGIFYFLVILPQKKQRQQLQDLVTQLKINDEVVTNGGIIGKIKEVKILRENNGVRQLGTLDLTSKSIFNSEYYQLQQNDVVLVDQNRYKLRQTEQTRISQQIGFALSIITSIALLYNIFQ